MVLRCMFCWRISLLGLRFPPKYISCDLKSKHILRKILDCTSRRPWKGGWRRPKLVPLNFFPGRAKKSREGTRSSRRHFFVSSRPKSGRGGKVGAGPIRYLPSRYQQTFPIFFTVQLYFCWTAHFFFGIAQIG